MMDNITLDFPVPITLTPVEVQTIIQGLNEMPYKRAQPVIEHILLACREQAQKGAE